MRGKKFLVGTVAISLALVVALGGVLVHNTVKSKASVYDGSTNRSVLQQVYNENVVPDDDSLNEVEENIQEEVILDEETKSIMSDDEQVVIIREEEPVVTGGNIYKNIGGAAVEFVVGEAWKIAKQKTSDWFSCKPVVEVDNTTCSIDVYKNVKYNQTVKEKNKKGKVVKKKYGGTSELIINCTKFPPKSQYPQKLSGNPLASVGIRCAAGPLNAGAKIQVIVRKVEKIKGKEVTLGKKVLDKTIKATGFGVDTVGCDMQYFNIKKASDFGKYHITFVTFDKLTWSHRISYNDSSRYVPDGKYGNHLVY